MQGWIPPPPQTVTVDVPSDGIHLEVGAGICILDNLPTSGTTVDLAVKDASLHVEQG
jgi:hypothetical protein